MHKQNRNFFLTYWKLLRTQQWVSFLSHSDFPQFVLNPLVTITFFNQLCWNMQEFIIIPCFSLNLKNVSPLYPYSGFIRAGQTRMISCVSSRIRREVIGEDATVMTKMQTQMTRGVMGAKFRICDNYINICLTTYHI